MILFLISIGSTTQYGGGPYNLKKIFQLYMQHILHRAIDRSSNKHFIYTLQRFSCRKAERSRPKCTRHTDFAKIFIYLFILFR